MAQESDPPRASGLESARRRIHEILSAEVFVDRPEIQRQAHEFAVWDATVGRFLFPAFQYTVSGQVRPETEELLAVLPAHKDGWRAAFWLYQPHARLGGARPVDVFDANPAAVILAARSTFEPRDTNW